MPILFAGFFIALAGLIALLFLPPPLEKRAALAPTPEPLRLPDTEPAFDPLAFWLFPDWDSGPIDEPFWMRPLKEPVANRPNFNGGQTVPLVWGKPRLAPVPVEWEGARVKSYMRMQSGKMLVEIVEADGDTRVFNAEDLPEGVNLPTH